MNDRNEHYRDRKLELGLAEKLGAEQPPDLSDRILAGKDDEATPVAPPKPVRRRNWLALALATSLAVAFTGYVVSVEWSRGPDRRGDRVVAIFDVSSSSTNATDVAEIEAASDVPRLVSGRHKDAGRRLEEFEEELGADDWLSTVEGQKEVEAEIPRAELDLGSSDAPADVELYWRGALDTQSTQYGRGGEPLQFGEANSSGQVPPSDATGPSRLSRRLGTGTASAVNEDFDAPWQTMNPVSNGALRADRRNHELVESERERVLAMESTQRNFATLSDELKGLRDEIETVKLDRDGQSNRATELTDQIQQARTVRARLEQRREQLAGEVAVRTEVQGRHGVSAEEPAGEPPVGVRFVVTATSDSGLVEISGGSDDGLREGHFFDVADGQSYMGRIKIRKTSPDRSVGQILPAFKKGDVKKGNVVVATQTGKSTDRVADRTTTQVDRPKTPPKPKKTWRRAVASPNATRLVIGDKDELLPAGVQANVVVDGFRARVLLDWYYYNDRGRREGTFKLRLPNEASLYYLAFGPTSIEYRPQGEQVASLGFLTPELLRSSGTGPDEILSARGSTWDNVKEARLVPRQKAAYAYSETVRRRVDPALAEWSGAGVFQCRVFPLEQNRLHRIVVGYDVNLTQDGDDLVYQFDIPDGLPQCAIDLNVAAQPGSQVEIAPDVRPFTSGGRAYYHFDQPPDDKITLRMKDPQTVLLTGSDELAGDFFATRVQPQLPAGDEQVGSSHAVLLVDTSLSSRPDKFNTYLDLLAAILNENRGLIEQFSVLFFNIESHWWQDRYVENTPQNVTRLREYCHTLALEGATDLKQALAEAVQPTWQEQDAQNTPRPDLFLLSDGAITWGDDNLHLIGKTIADGAAGSLFAYKTGQSGTASYVLEHLTRETGGAVFSIASDEEIVAAAKAHGRRPWMLLDVNIEGGSDLMLAGRPRNIYPGQQLTVVGRGTPQAGSELVFKVKRGGQNKTVRVPLKTAIQSELAPRAYGQVSVGQLENLLPATEETSVAYARHFRVAGQSCSLLMLDSEADYNRFQIKPEDDAFLVSSFPAAELVTRVLDETASHRTDPKWTVVDWLDRLQTMQGCQVALPTATKLAIESMPERVFDVRVPRLVCQVRDRRELTDEYSETLDAAQLDYDQVAREAERRLLHDTKADALKAVSCLIERNPGDMVLLRDVAFSSMKWGFGGQAYPLLKRVAVARPYQPQVYTAMARCLAELGQADLALVNFEVALSGQWSNRYQDFGKIARMEYVHFLRRVVAGELETCVPDFAAARLTSLRSELAAERFDLVILMEWNTDRTDVDLHVVEPSGEVCKYDHNQTRSGGRLTDDVTEGFGPEMYTLPTAPEGKYSIKVNYYGGDQNRTSARTKVYLSVYRFFGTPQEQVERHAVTLQRTHDTQDVATVGVGKD